MKECSYCKQHIGTGQKCVTFKKPNASGKFMGDYDHYHSDCWTIVYRSEAAEAEHRPAWDKIMPTALAEIDYIKGDT